MIYGLEALKKKLRYLERDAQREALEVAGATLVDLTVERFSSETDPYGVAWKKSRRAAREGGQTLSDKGILRRSFSHVVVSDDTIAYGTNDKRANTHQYGRKITMTAKQQARFGVKQVTIPARKMIPDRGDPPIYDEALQAALEAHIQEALQ